MINVIINLIKFSSIGDLAEMVCFSFFGNRNNLPSLFIIRFYSVSQNKLGFLVTKKICQLIQNVAIESG